MTVAFLSQEWLDEVQKRLNASDQFRSKSAGVDAVIQQVVPAPDGERRYWLRIEGGQVSVGAGDAEAPDVVITQDLKTAEAMSRKELNPVTAFMTGRLKVTGNMGLLMKLQSAISELPTAMEDVEVAY